MKPLRGWSHWGTHELGVSELVETLTRLLEQLGELHPKLVLVPTRDVVAAFERGESMSYRHGGEHPDVELIVGLRAFESAYASVFRYGPEVFEQPWIGTGMFVLNVFTDEVGVEVLERVGQVLEQDFPAQDQTRADPRARQSLEEAEAASVTLLSSLVGGDLEAAFVQQYWIDGELQEDGEGPVEFVFADGRVVHAMLAGNGIHWLPGSVPEWCAHDPAGREHRTCRLPLDDPPTGRLLQVAGEHHTTKWSASRDQARGWELGFASGTLRVRGVHGPGRTIVLQRDGCPYVRVHGYTTWHPLP